MLNGHYTVKQAAALLGLKRKTLVMRIERGTVTAEKLEGKLWIIAEAEVQRLREQQPRGGRRK